MQRKLTGAGYLASVLAEPYPPFPGDPLGRISWAEGAPLRNAVAAKCVLIILARRADKTGKAWPGIDSLAHWAGLSVRSAQTALRTLEGRRWLLTHERPGRSSYYYPKSPDEGVCWCGVRWAGAILCADCMRQADLFQPAAEAG